MTTISYELNQKVHATIINPYLSEEEFTQICDLISKFKIKNITTSLCFLEYIREKDSFKDVQINTLISYPLSDLPKKFINEILLFAKDFGTNGIEYVPKFFLLSKNDEEMFANDLENIIKSELPITIILNKNKLDKKSFEKVIKIALELDIKKFQFGDGFGATIKNCDIANIRKLISDKCFIKVVGGIKKLNQVIEFLDAGADSIGTSNFYNIFQDLKQFK